MFFTYSRRLPVSFLLAVLVVAVLSLSDPGRSSSDEHATEAERFQALPPGATGRLGQLDFRSGTDPAVAFSPDGKVYYSSAQHNEIRAWVVATGQLRHRFRLPPVRSAISQLRCLPDGTLVALALDGFVLFVDPDRGTIHREIRLDDPDGRSRIGCMDVAADGKTLAVGAEARIRLFDIASGRELPFDVSHVQKVGDQISGWVRHVTFSPDGNRLVSNAIRDRQRVWDVRTGKELSSFDQERFPGGPVAFSPDGRLVALQTPAPTPDQPGRQSATELWHRDPFRLAVRLEGLSWASTLAFRSDGKLLAIGS